MMSSVCSSFISSNVVIDLVEIHVLTLEVNRQRLVFTLGPVSDDQGVGLRDDVVSLFSWKKDVISSNVVIIFSKSTLSLKTMKIE